MNIVIFNWLIVVLKIEVFVITIKNIEKYKQKQTISKPNSIKILLIKFQEFANIFLKKRLNTLSKYRKKYDYYIELKKRR